MEKIYSEQTVDKIVKLSLVATIKELEKEYNFKFDKPGYTLPDVVDRIQGLSLIKDILFDREIFNHLPKEKISIEESIQLLKLTELQKSILRVILQNNNTVTKDFLMEKLNAMGLDLLRGSAIGGILGGLRKKCEANRVDPLVLIKKDEVTQTISYSIDNYYIDYLTKIFT